MHTFKNGSKNDNISI